MNTQALKTHQKMFAMILGVAVIAAVGGSMAYAQTAPSTGSGSTYTPIQGSVNIPQVILSNVKVNFVDAANTAAKQITGGGQVLSGGLVIQNGYAVYAFKVTDGKSVYLVIVDAGNGQVLKTSQGHPLSLLAFGGMNMGHGMMHKRMAGAWSKAPTGTTPPSTTTPSGFQE